MTTRFVQLILLTFVVAFVNYATASPFNIQARAQCSGDVPGMSDVENAFKEDAQFCKFWLATKRKNSPIPGLEPSVISSACKCIAARATPTSKSIKAPTPKPTVCATASDPYYSAALDDISQPDDFCKFWLLDRNRIRTVVPGVGHKQLSSICSCVATSSKSPSSTSTSTLAQVDATPSGSPSESSSTSSASPTEASQDASSSPSSSSVSVNASPSSSYTSESSTTTSTSTQRSTSPTPKSDAAICPALSGDTLVDPSGTSYAMQCDKSYSGTVISGGSRKRDAEFTIENCLTACNGVSDCVAVTVLNGACTMLSDIDGVSTQYGAAAALNEVRAEGAGISEETIPSLDPPDSSQTSIEPSTQTATASDGDSTPSSSPGADDDSPNSTSTDGSTPRTSTEASTATDSSTPSSDEDDSGASDSTSSSPASATQTSPPARTTGDESGDSSSTPSSTSTAPSSDPTQPAENSTASDEDASNPTQTQSTPADSNVSNTAMITASSTPENGDLFGCSAPSASIINGLPAVACGANFNQALNDVLGYYSGNSEDVAAVESSIIPGLGAVGNQRRALSETIQTVAKDAISSILEAARSVAGSIVAALPGDVQDAEAAVDTLSQSVAYGVASPTGATQVALKRGLDSVHKPGTQWSFARRAVDMPDQRLRATGLSTGSPSSSVTTSSGTAPVSTSTSFSIVMTGTAPTSMANSTSFQIISTGIAPTQAFNGTSSIPVTTTSVGTITPLPVNQTAPTFSPNSNDTVPLSTGASLPTTSSLSVGSTGLATIYRPANSTFGLPAPTPVSDEAPFSTSTMAGNQSVVLSTGGLLASPTSSVILSTGASSSPTVTTTLQSNTIPTISSNATAPVTDKVNSAPITITDTTKSLLLQPGSDGSLFVSTTNADVSSLSSSSFVCDESNDVVFGDSNSRLLHYFPSELATLGASRFRLAGWGEIPTGASLLNLVPLQTDAAGEPVLIAVDSLSNYVWPFVCGLQGQTNKVFLVNDLDNGASILEGSDLVYTVVGGVAQDCAPLALTGDGMTGINA